MKFFFTKNLNKTKEEKKIFFRSRTGRGSGLEQVIFFTKNPNLKKNIFFSFFFFFFGGGGG